MTSGVKGRSDSEQADNTGMEARETILLLGAGGFVGAHLAIELAKRGNHAITALDITREKLDEGLQRAATLDLVNQSGERPGSYAALTEGLRYVDLDIMEPANDQQLAGLIAEHDVVVNMVAICNPALYVSDPIHTFEVGFRGNLKVVDMCERAGRRLIQFSTSEVYGKSPSVYVADRAFVFEEDESNLIMGPINKHRWIYASGKQLLERVIHAYGLKRGFRYAIIRPFNYIGEMIDYLPSRQAGSPRVFSHFMDALLQGRPLKLVDGGLQRRCYTYIADATDAHVRIIENAEACHQQIFNVGTSRNETTIRDLALRMREIYRTHFLAEGEKLSEIVEVSGEEFYGEGYDDIDRRLLSNEKLIRLTGWQPKYDLDAMLLRIMRYYVGVAREEGGGSKASTPART